MTGQKQVAEKNADLVIKWLHESPDTSYRTIARELGISGERVRQIAKLAGFPARRKRILPRPCLVCRQVFLPKENRTKSCSFNCGHALSRISQHVNALVILTCDECGQDFPRLRGDVTAAIKNNRHHVWCGKVCQGRHLGKLNGGKKKTPKIDPKTATEKELCTSYPGKK